MNESGHRKPNSFRGESLSRRRSWCCSFALPPSSPDTLYNDSRHHNHHHIKSRQQGAQSDLAEKHGPFSIPFSPQSSKSSLNIMGRVDPRRILSPGRVSPIDSDTNFDSIKQNDWDAETAVTDSVPKSRPGSFRAPKIAVPISVAGMDSDTCSGPSSVPECVTGKEENYDARLSLKGRNGGVLILELSSVVLAGNSEVFAALIAENKKALCSYPSSSLGLKNTCRIVVSDVGNLGVFRETIELMFEDDDGIIKKLMKMGVYRAIDVLEVAAGIKFTRAVFSCLRYIEAVPWTEEEEEKLREVLMLFTFDDAATSEIVARFYSTETECSHQSLSKQLVWSITSAIDANARNELKSLVKGLLCKSSVYEKEQPELSKEDIYEASNSCLDSLADLIEEASSTTTTSTTTTSPSTIEERKWTSKGKSLIERVSRLVDNINWLLEIMVDRHIAEDFVDIWAKQRRLFEMHERTSPMVRYELSRVSGFLFIAMGTRKLQCRSESRSGVLEAWFRPMLVDFGWLQRCKKGLDMRQLEEGLGQTLLTLPLKQQYPLFMEWFRWFSKHGTECPNLSKAFQIWWRRSFLRGSETQGIESR